MRIPILVVLVMSMSGTARAQSRWLAVFALFGEGSVLSDHTSRLAESPAAVGGGGAIGFLMSDHFSVRFETEIPTMHAQTHTQTFGGLTTVQTEQFRIKTYTGLVASHFQPHKRVNVAFLVGLSEAVPETRISGYFEEYGAGAILRRDIDSRASYHTGALTVGVDMAFAVTQNLAVVPELRFHGLNDESATRVKVALRLGFF